MKGGRGERKTLSSFTRKSQRIYKLQSYPFEHQKIYILVIVMNSHFHAFLDHALLNKSPIRPWI